MSKKFNAVLAFLFTFFTFTSIALAQVDYEGIEPILDTPPVVNEPTTETLSTQILNLRNIEQTHTQNSKIRYISALEFQNDYISDPEAASATQYKLDSILVSARYHRLLDLYLNYLQQIDQNLANSTDTTGFGLTGSEGDLEQTILEVENASALVAEFDVITDSFNGTTEAEVMAVYPELVDKSNNIKVSLENIRLDLLNLVELMQ